jgi:hypothetical protein
MTLSVCATCGKNVCWLHVRQPSPYRGFAPCCPCRVRTTVLGSRNQLCLNEKVLKLPGQAGNFTCRALVQHKQCRW